MSVEAKAKKEREDVVLQWETCDRITQGTPMLYPESMVANRFGLGLNNFLKCASQAIRPAEKQIT
jgi:hypothetical protein